jgi:hypothetical protein
MITPLIVIIFLQFIIAHRPRRWSSGQSCTVREVLGSIPDLERGPLSLVSIHEKLLKKIN